MFDFHVIFAGITAAPLAPKRLNSDIVDPPSITTRGQEGELSYTQMVSSGNYTGIWGPVTSTLDWCEVSHPSAFSAANDAHPLKANYQFSPFVAEMANTFSNLITISLGLYGWYVALQQKLPACYPVGFLVRLVLASQIVDRRIHLISNPLIGCCCCRIRKFCLSRVFAVRSPTRRRVTDGHGRVILALHLVRLTKRVHLRRRPWDHPPHRFQRPIPHLVVRSMAHSLFLRR